MSESNLLNEIEEEALRGDVLTALRLCLRLGGETRSGTLREWAARELKGYEHDAVPDYRLVQAPLFIDSISGNNWFKGQQITPSFLSEVVRPTFPSQMSLIQPLSEIVTMSETEDSVHLTPAVSGEILGIGNSELSDFQQIIALYWKVSPATLQAIPDTVRTTIVELIAELRPGMDSSDALPNQAQTDRAVSVAIHGDGHRVVVNTATGDGMALYVVEEDELGPGSTVEFDFTFPSEAIGADLEFACYLEGHYEAGMHTGITVEG